MIFIKNIKAAIGDIIIFTADEKNNTIGRLTAEEVKPGQIYTMTIHVDAGFLKDEKTLYPIRIDPTIEIRYSNNAQSIQWRSSNTNIATVNSSTGEVAGVSPGTVNIYSNNYSFGYTLIVAEIPNGTYFIQNKQTSKFVDIQNQVMANGTQTHQWAFHGGNTQKWEIEHYGDGYYYIRSYNTSAVPFYYLTVQNNSTVEGAKVVLQSSISTGSQWKITSTASGCYKITAKTGEANNRVLAVEVVSGDNTANGLDMEQKNYQNNNSYLDEWNVLSMERNVINLEVIYDQAYLNRYSDATTRINNHLIALREKYLADFGIWIEYSEPSIFSSHADINCSTAYNHHCTHTNDSGCYNSVLYEGGSTYLYNLHHNNIINIMLHIPFPNTETSVKLAYIGHDNCFCERLPGNDQYNPNGFIQHAENPFYGLACESIGLITVMNFNSQNNATKTTVHEFGHLLGAQDHYGSGGKSTEEMRDETGYGFSRNCIYGENKDAQDVVSNLTICDGCKLYIEKNINKYNH